MKARTRTIARKLGIGIASTLILLGILVGAGFGYAWYTSKNAPTPATNPVTPAPVAEIKRAAPDPNAPAYAAIQSLTTPVVPGENASVTIKSNLKAKCAIIVEYNGTASTDSGLVEKPADDFGIVTWAWTVGAHEPEGERLVKMTCKHNDKTAFVQGSLIVTKTKLEPATAAN